MKRGASARISASRASWNARLSSPRSRRTCCLAWESAVRRAAESGLGSDLRAAYRSSWVMYS